MSTDPFDLDLEPGHGGVEFGKVSDTDEPAASTDPTEAWIREQSERLKAAMAQSDRGEIASDAVALTTRETRQDADDEIHGWGYQIILPYDGEQGWQWSQGSTGWDREEAIEYAKEALAEHRSKGRIQISALRQGWRPDSQIFDYEIFDRANEIADHEMLLDDEETDAFDRIEQADAQQLLAMLHEAWTTWCAFHRHRLMCMHFSGPIITILAEDEGPGDDEDESA
jgi:hypothetical protein